MVTLVISLIIALTACENSENDDSPNEETTNTVNKHHNRKVNPPLEINKNASTQKRIDQLKEIAMIYYTGEGALEEAEEAFEKKGFEGKNDVVEEAFKRASLIDPYDMDLMYSLASVHILKKDIPAALDVYNQMLYFDENQFKPLILKLMGIRINLKMV